MGTETYPKQGRAHQGKSYQGKNKVLQTGAGLMGKASAPSSQDVCTKSRGTAYSLSSAKTKAC